MGLIVSLFFGVVCAGASAPSTSSRTWTTMRASFGQKFLKLETVNAADGATLTPEPGHPALGCSCRRPDRHRGAIVPDRSAS